MNYVKYPKTMHLPWSPGLQNDDRLIQSLDAFKGREVVVTEKMDGENATLYRDHYHARSLDSRHHPSRDWIKAFHGQIKHLIPTEWAFKPANYRICGENMYAEHSIRYEDLPSYFLGFSMWDGACCLPWDQTLEWFDKIGITPVKTLWRGPFEEFLAHHEHLDASVSGNVEGYVVRKADGFLMRDFSTSVAKYVRKDHIQTDQHWMAKPVSPNGLAK